MEENNLQGVVKTILDKQKEAGDAMLAKTAVELDSMKQELVRNAAEAKAQAETLAEQLNTVETNLKKTALNTDAPSLNGSIEKIVNGKDFKDGVVEAVKNNQKVDYSFDTKLIRNANTISAPTSFVSGDAPVVLPFRELGVDKAPVRPPAVADLIQWGTTSSNMIDWIERTSKTNGAASRTENGLMGQGDAKYTEKSTKVKILSEYMKVTNESLKDAGFLSSEINSELLSDLNVLLDEQLLNGDGVGANLLGILPQASAFAAGSFALSIVAPNEADVLRVATNQILTNGKMRWYPSAILMHPDDVAKLDVMKIADGRYIEVPYYDANGQSIVKVPIVMNTGIAAGTYLVADFNRAKGFVRDNLTIRVFNQNENDAIANRSTITGNVRVAFRIKEQEKGAFVSGTFATDITALTKV